MLAQEGEIALGKTTKLRLSGPKAPLRADVLLIGYSAIREMSIGQSAKASEWQALNERFLLA